MLKNYLRVALRNLTRNKFSAVLNIGGLAIGMAVAILIGIWVYDEVSFNKSFGNYDRIAGVFQNQRLSGGVDTWTGEAMQLAPVLRKEYGKYFKYVITAAQDRSPRIEYADKKIKLDGGFYEPDVLRMFPVKMLRGGDNALEDPSSIVLSETAVKELFGKEDPIGKTIMVDLKTPAKVTGVYADFPANCDWTGTHFLGSFQWLVNSRGWAAGPDALEWGNSWFNTYVLLNPNVDIAAASNAIRDVKYRYSPGDRRFDPKLFVYPMERWHLHHHFENGVASGGRIVYVRLYSIIGLFVLLLACINFMNLSTARSEKRAKEVGIRKAIGSLRRQLIGQFFSESLVIAFFSFVLSIGVAQLLLPFFVDIAQQKMTIPYGSPLFWIAGLLFAFLTGLLAGSYPALYLSGFQPIKVLKGSFKVGKLASVPRKALVVLQFTVSVVLIIGTLVIYNQVQYVKNRPVGYTREGLLMASMHNDDIRAHFKSLCADLKATGMISDVSGSQDDATNNWINNMGFTWTGKDPALQENFITNGVTPDFGRSTGWQISQGRDFAADMPSDSGSFIINETAVKYMGFKEPIGQIVKWGDNGKFTVIGVAKDMISENPDQPIPPMIFFLGKMTWIHTVNMRLARNAGVPQALSAISAVFKKYDPENPLDYRFADQEYAKKFEDEERAGRLVVGFTALAILISCLGLLGLSAFVAEQRTREIGVRKVLGANVFHVWRLLSGEFVVLVGLSILIAGPLGYWAMHSWLQGYAYHASLSWWIFAVTALGAIVITLLTVSVQSIRAALANPVDSLRSE